MLDLIAGPEDPWGTDGLGNVAAWTRTFRVGGPGHGALQMSLSRHTVKAEVTSIYRKLGASSRDQAVMRARDLGLLDR